MNRIAPLRSLHSRYNPAGEAERYVRSLALREEALCFILIEPGLGYLIPFLRQRRPDARLIVLHAVEPDEPLVPEAASLPAWDPSCGGSPQRFLEQHAEAAASAIQVVEWRPALAAYGGHYRSLLAETAAFIKRLSAGEQTLRCFGRRWFSNFFRNLRLVTRCARPRADIGLPVIIAGAGPSLESALPLIREQKDRGRALVFAAASATQSLMAGGVAPDCVVSTDGGSWAQNHLYEALRPGLPFIVAASMNAALPSQCAGAPLLLMSDASVWQNLILNSLGLPFVGLPQRGTVTASALDLAFRLTSGDVAISGTDLAVRDIRLHARPYSFERLLEEKARRFLPLYTQYFVRSRAEVQGGAHDVYAAWFKEHLDRYAGRLYSLGSNNPVFGNAPPWGSRGRGGNAPRVSKAAGRWWEPARFSRRCPDADAAALLLGALSSGAAVGAALKEELVPLLFPGRASGAVSLKELGEAVRTLSKLERRHA
jgi:hypothetical protein